MHKLELVIENEIHKVPWDFELSTDDSIQARKPDKELIKMKKIIWQLENFAISGNHKKQKTKKRKWKIRLGSYPWNEKAMEHESDGVTQGGFYPWNGT